MSLFIVDKDIDILFFGWLIVVVVRLLVFVNSVNILSLLSAPIRIENTMEKRIPHLLFRSSFFRSC